ncbi:branched-chain amino acid transport system substrate-binding protein [Camelimonas lactis]|uniref:Branched-chain amino acid transport system substrate-binding protein n=2 Tax=Camelimonas lactis TaxID=659006 RepID=A0A4R2GSF8_9HYPH|nr:branched-chain amino acid transport system substrate-binding protein [Camelimonas lactis]
MAGRGRIHAMLRAARTGTALCAAAGALALALAGGAQAQDKPAGKDEIRIGNVNAYSGPAAVYAVLGKVPAAYFRMMNDQGGVGGRQIRFITYDDAYSPPKTVEQTRKLVENDQVAVMYGSLGAPTSSATLKYLNGHKIPHIFIASGATKFGDQAAWPWTMGFQPSYQTEGKAFAANILQTRPDAKIAVLYQNDDFGRDVLKGFKDGLGDKAKMIVAEASYESTDPTIDSQIVKLKASGADVFMNMTTPKFAAQAIRKIAELGWKPTHYLGSNANSIAAVLGPAGLDNAKDIISSAYLKDANDPEWKDDPAFKKWNAFYDKYLPDADRKDALTVYAYVAAQTMEQVLRQAGDDVTPANIMKQAANLKHFRSDLLLPGIEINTAPDDHYPIEQLQLIRFDGKQYVRFGPVIDSSKKR